jgi:hypothetical protein
MRLHSSVLAPSDIYRATTAAGMTGVNVELTSHGSRSRAAAYNVHLTGTSSRRPNSGKGGAGHPDDRAATWDEWGMFLAALFELDPDMIAGTAYASREHFRAVTHERFDALTAPYQHGGGGHRWTFVAARYFECESCSAQMEHLPARDFERVNA